MRFTAGSRALSYNNDISFARYCFPTSAFIRKLQLNPDPHSLARILTRTCTGQDAFYEGFECISSW